MASNPSCSSGSLRVTEWWGGVTPPHARVWDVLPGILGCVSNWICQAFRGEESLETIHHKKKMSHSTITSKTECKIWIGTAEGGLTHSQLTAMHTRIKMGNLGLLTYLLLRVLHPAYAHLAPPLHAHWVSMWRGWCVCLARRVRSAPWLLWGGVRIAGHAIQLGALHSHEVHGGYLWR